MNADTIANLHATKERPIIFSAPMVRAILEGRKTMTRRVVKLPVIDHNGTGCEIAGCEINGMLRDGRFDICPYGKPGQTLWVRESWAKRTDTEDGTEHAKHYLIYRADGDGAVRDERNWHDWGGKWRPSIFMPRWASRITLEVTGVRVERLHDITEEDAKSEGAPWLLVLLREEGPTLATIKSHGHRMGFAKLWESINGKGSWAKNPWVWVIQFKRI